MGTTSTTASPLIDQRLWLGPTGPGPQTRLFRQTFAAPAEVSAAQVRIYAESNYHAWLNGQYLGRGPIYHHPTLRPYDTHDLRPHLRPGKNVLAVLVHTPATAIHNHVPSGEPGLTVGWNLTDAAARPIPVTGRWKATDRTGWSGDVPKRTWAIGHIEQFDAAAAPAGWQSIDFDDQAWPDAEVITPATNIDGVEWVARPLPALRYGYAAPTRLISLHRFDAPVEPITAADNGGAVAKRLLTPPWLPADGDLRISDFDPATGSFTVHGLSPGRGAMVCFDLGKQVTGQLTFDADCPSAGTIDVGWSETFEQNKPWLCRKGGGYCDRILAPAGKVHWEPIGYSSMRYLLVCLRGFTGSVRFERFGIRTSEPDLDWSRPYDFGDDRLNAIWQLCIHTFRIGTQEGVLDCPTREQAVYIGDGLLIARWIAQVTGDARHWKYVVHEQFRRQAENGMLRASIFSATNDTLIDYPLLAITGLRDYWQFTRDPDALKHIEACRKVLRWFDARRGSDVLCPTPKAPANPSVPWERKYDPKMPDISNPEAGRLFVDHPGMGWHNINEAGIDRRGLNCALNALLVQARRALAQLEEAAGHGDRAASLRADADATAAAIGERLFDRTRSVFADGMLEGRLLEQVSEQGNTWAVAAGCCDDDTARAALLRVLKRDDPSIARNGPYFWAYLFPELARLGLHKLALDSIPALWGPMLDGGATALWETFLGDDLDSWCHPWSAAPVEFLLEHVLGLPRVAQAGTSATLRPRPDLLPRARGQAWTAAGWFAIDWQTDPAGNVTLTGRVPEGQSATLIHPTDSSRHTVQGEWRLTLPLR